MGLFKQVEPILKDISTWYSRCTAEDESCALYLNGDIYLDGRERKDGKDAWDDFVSLYDKLRHACQSHTMGGKVRAEKLSPARRAEIARNAANARWKK